MSEHENLIYWLKGDMAAVAFCEAVFRVSQTYDDLIDRDMPVSEEQIHRVFWECLVEIPANPFYQRHQHFLRPLLQASIVDWRDSNELARGGDDDQNIAFVLRDSVSSLAIHCAFLVGGREWMLSVSPAIRRAIFDEDLSKYKLQVEHETWVG